MSDKTSLGNRMKNFYENPFRYYLPRRTPMILRLDMKAGHSFTKGFMRPFDDLFILSIQKTAKYLCKNIEGVRCSYQQSDEISLLLADYDNIETEAWFGKNLQKMVSVSASMATLAFNRAFNEEVNSWLEGYNTWAMFASAYETPESCTKAESFKKVYERATLKGALFDSRAFVLPKEEVNNYFLWRQNDCTRNSIQMVGQANFSHKELQGKSCNDIQNMLLMQKDINWNDFSTEKKRGSCCTKTGVNTIVDIQTGAQKERLVWEIDKEIPIFSEDTNYIERFI